MTTPAPGEAGRGMEREDCPWCKRYMDRHMSAYYYGFEPTGETLIDNVLCSVATAGKGAHHTEHWDEFGYPDLIQRAAIAAAAELTALRAELSTLRARCEKLVDAIYTGYSPPRFTLSQYWLTAEERAAAQQRALELGKGEA